MSFSEGDPAGRGPAGPARAAARPPLEAGTRLPAGAGNVTGTGKLAGTHTEAVQLALVIPLRREVLRPGRPLQESDYAGDHDPAVVHVALRHRSGMVLAVGTTFPEPAPWPVGIRDGPCWRIRGMATHPGRRGRGHGRAVLDELLRRSARHGGGLVWCNARVPAVTFYLRAGFEPVGPTFVLPVIGEHQAMQRRTPRR